MARAINDNQPDLQFTNCGSFAIIWPVSDMGTEWALDNLPDDDTNGSGQWIIEHRYLSDIVLGARADGLVCHG